MQIELMNMQIDKIQKQLKKLSNHKKAIIYAKFFKAGKGQYGYGDFFYGIEMPKLHILAKKFTELRLENVQILLHDKYHECRMLGLLILTEKYKIPDIKNKKEIFRLYIKNYNNINNWDLVDVTAPKIVGQYLLDKIPQRKILYKFASSKNLWKKRIAIISTLTFIRNCETEDTLKICKILLNDNHDLIHKAAGWMLREVGKKNINAEEEFLNKYYKKMPRTMLRYAIEKFSSNKKTFYMTK